ncbi:preprotein translocase subunit YajC [Streptococcus ovuberis]|uniref:Preprotein translocase subunit YajC n=1 Tax=Streptococcus ovuberis TaxID=1936207 RepID=A0A7X6MYN3_9STRE|nr:preprotein translocase subunit YajC [Streptococcus ovuberis]NKZ20805.1 preprotein translocase subunit YajC [Streptococcus ovuberis]
MNGSSFLIMGIVMIGMMFLTMRSQKKQQQARLDMINSMKPGDKVVTIGGLYGVVDSIDTEVNTVTLDIDGIYLTFERAAIRTVVAAGTPVVTPEDLSPADPVEPVVSESMIEE